MGKEVIESNINNSIPNEGSMRNFIKKCVQASIIFLYKVTREPIQIWQNIVSLQVKFDPAVSIGKHTYGLNFETISLAPSLNKPSVTIGNYCSIAPGVVILANADHRTNLPSTFPFRTRVFARLDGRKPVKYFDFDAVSKGDIVIGHDVWIGQNVTVLSGVSIGTGAVIGANSLVTKNIPPYSIAVGNPAKVLRARFSLNTIERLLKSEWWNLSDEQIIELEPFFYNPDIDEFLNQVTLLKNS
jgi:acetyltransferase-like isoleucine patch superfamily enzyme